MKYLIKAVGDKNNICNLDIIKTHLSLDIFNKCCFWFYFPSFYRRCQRSSFYLSKRRMSANPGGDHSEGVPVVPVQEGHHGQRLVPDGRG